MARKSTTPVNASEHLILSLVTDHYLKSEFNGLSCSVVQRVMELGDRELRRAVRSLIADGMLDINFGQNFGNIAIRAWSLGSIEMQLQKFDTSEPMDFILYPALSHLKRAASRKFRGQSFTRELAFGRGQLEPEFFDVSVLEFYRNDPRYYYRCNSVSGQISVSDAFYASSAMAESDKVLLQTFGFGFDDQMNRYVAAYLIYLSRLSPEHQRIWNAKRITVPCTLHPDYYSSTIRGWWPEKVIIFDAFRRELRHINRICVLLGWRPLFKRDFVEEGLRDFCFLLRPTLKEFDGFIHLLDKMISDNIDPQFFVGKVELETEKERRKDGKVIVTKKATLSLLNDWLLDAGDWNPETANIVKRIMAPLREVRTMRRRPAHAIDENVFDQSYLKQQRELMVRIYDSVQSIRQIFYSHPNVQGYEVESMLLDGKIRTF